MLHFSQLWYFIVIQYNLSGVLHWYKNMPFPGCTVNPGLGVAQVTEILFHRFTVQPNLCVSLVTNMLFNWFTVQLNLDVALVTNMPFNGVTWVLYWSQICPFMGLQYNMTWVLHCSQLCLFIGLQFNITRCYIGHKYSHLWSDMDVALFTTMPSNGFTVYLLCVVSQNLYTKSILRAYLQRSVNTNLCLCIGLIRAVVCID